jgi:hypothetical protein
VQIEHEEVVNRQQIPDLLMEGRCFRALDDAAVARDDGDVADGVSLQ